LSRDDPPSDLQAAATALASELVLLEKTIHETDRLPIDSDKALQRARKMLESCASHEVLLAQHLQALAGAIQASQLRIQTCMDQTVELSRRIQERSEQRTALLERVAALGRRAHDIQAPIQSAMARGIDGSSPGEALIVVGEVVTLTGTLLDEATSIATDARAADWADVARQADGLRQQIQAVRGKVVGLQRSLGERAPS
jgi:hypothetical protein